MTATDTDILAACAAGAEQGFRLLMSVYAEPVYWHLRRLLVSHDDAQDAAQETFIRVFRALPTFEARRPLRPWIYRIATNEALRSLRRRQPPPIADDDAPQTPAPQYVDYSDLEAVHLQQAIQTLPEKQRIAFTLRYYDDMTYADIADITGSSPASAKTSYHIAKDKIANYMTTHQL